MTRRTGDPTGLQIISGFEDAGWHDLDDSGAYEWWYFDAISDDGRTAVVLIWFAGLPFSPDYLTDHEAGRDPRALDHAAIFAAVYVDGRQIGYALNRHGRDDVEFFRDALGARIGKSSFTANQLSIRVDLDLPLLSRGHRLTGRLDVDPSILTSSHDLDSLSTTSNHVWNPISLESRFEGRLEISEASSGVVWSSDFAGRGYHDHNYGSTPLTEGIERWHWGRVHCGDWTALFYRNEPTGGGTESLLVVANANGTQLVSDRASFVVDRWRWRPLCPRHPFAISASLSDHQGEVALTARLAHVLDWGPFYMRFLCDFTLQVDGRQLQGLGITEYLSPAGLRRRAYRPLIKTRIALIGRD